MLGEVVGAGWELAVEAEEALLLWGEGLCQKSDGQHIIARLR